MSAIMMNVVPQLNVTVDNIPGQLAKIARALAEEGISIVGLSCTENKQKAIWHIVVDKTDIAKRVLADIGFLALTDEIFGFLCPEDQPGVIAKIAEACADAGVNIGSIYTAATGLNQPAMVYMWVDKEHFAKARAACAKVK